MTKVKQNSRLDEFGHKPVMLDEVIKRLNIAPNSTIVDATLGGAGHSCEIYSRLSKDGLLIGFDQDTDALSAAKAKLTADAPLSEADKPELVLLHNNFGKLKTALQGIGVDKIDSILFDLGLSSWQIDNTERGFAYSVDAPLDMRMNPTEQTRTAADLLNTLPAADLVFIFVNLGEIPVPLARRLAKAIEQDRAEQPFTTSAQLNKLVESVYSSYSRSFRTKSGNSGSHQVQSAEIRKGNPSKRVFQALRIFINDELRNLQTGLDDALEMLKPNGSIVVLSYHSLEDRIVKDSFRRAAASCICPPASSVCYCNKTMTIGEYAKSPIKPCAEEIAYNKRSKSAKLRYALKAVA